MRALNWCLGVASLGLWLLPANAVNPLSAVALAALADPTRPPLSLVPAAAGTPEAASAASDAASAAAVAASQAAQLLTLVRVDAATGRGLAMIGGRMVAVGDRMGDATVAAVDASGVTLRTSRGLRRLSLWRFSNKASETPTAAATSGGKDQP